MAVGGIFNKTNVLDGDCRFARTAVAFGPTATGIAFLICVSAANGIEV
jgi:hypothetical protein